MVRIENGQMRFDDSDEGHEVRVVMQPRFSDDPTGDRRLVVRIMGQPSDEWLSRFTERLADLHQVWSITPAFAEALRYAYDFDRQDSELAKWFSQYMVGTHERELADNVYAAIEHRRTRLAAALRSL